MNIIASMKKIFASAIIFSLCATPGIAHPGRTNSEGCHGGSQGYHCHGKTVKPVVGEPVKPVAKYKRDNWDYNSRTARKRLKCTRKEHVDHIVALKEAFDSGASEWDLDQKEKFANDPINQMCLDGRLNMSKSDKDLGKWNGGNCELRKTIALKSIEVKMVYGLDIDDAEWKANARAILENCN